MNRPTISEETILKAAQSLILSKGPEALNMRAVATACGVAVGSIYNYFPSKNALVGAAVERTWQEVFGEFTKDAPYASALACTQALLRALEKGGDTHAGFFKLHALHFTNETKADGRSRMNRLFMVLVGVLQEAVENDPKVRDEVFQGALSSRQFARYVLTLAVSSSWRHEGEADALLALVKNALY